MLLTKNFNRYFLILFSSFAMVLMHIITVLIGVVLPLFMPEIVVSIIVIVLFMGFGLKLLWSSVLGRFLSSPCREKEAGKDTDTSCSCDSE